MTSSFSLRARTRTHGHVEVRYRLPSTLTVAVTSGVCRPDDDTICDDSTASDYVTDPSFGMTLLK